MNIPEAPLTCRLAGPKPLLIIDRYHPHLARRATGSFEPMQWNSIITGTPPNPAPDPVQLRRIGVGATYLSVMITWKIKAQSSALKVPRSSPMTPDLIKGGIGSLLPSIRRRAKRPSMDGWMDWARRVGSRAEEYINIASHRLDDGY